MAQRLPPLPFDPIEEAARQWGQRWDGVPQMRAVTSLMRVQQLVLAELDEILGPHQLSFARYEALVLLHFSRRGALTLGKMGSDCRSIRRPSRRSCDGSRPLGTYAASRIPTTVGRFSRA